MWECKGPRRRFAAAARRKGGSGGGRSSCPMAHIVQSASKPVCLRSPAQRAADGALHEVKHVQRQQWKGRSMRRLFRDQHAVMAMDTAPGAEVKRRPCRACARSKVPGRWGGIEISSNDKLAPKGKSPLYSLVSYAMQKTSK